MKRHRVAHSGRHVAGGKRRLAYHLQGLPIPVGAEVLVKETYRSGPIRLRDAFGHVNVHHPEPRYRVEYAGKDYWVDEGLLESAGT